MKKVTFPKKTMTVGLKVYSPEDALVEIVMTRPGWRRPGSTKIAISVSDKLDTPGPKIFTEMEYEMLVKEAALPESGGISPPEMNRFYFIVLQALYDAEEVIADPEKSLAAE
jgi:hypothetical protein